MFEPVELDTDPFSVRKGNYNLDQGKRVYGRGGYVYEFDRALSETEWLVYPMQEHQTWDGDSELLASDQPMILSPTSLYPKPPIPVVEKDIGEAETRLQDLNRQLREKKSELLQFEAEEKARAERIKRHEQLARLDDWINGKVTHILHLEKHSVWRIVEISEEEASDGDRYSRNKLLKLLTLWGKTNGDLNWRLSQYGDGSGSTDHEVVPFGSYDDALAYVKQHVEAEFAAWQPGITTPPWQAYKTAKQFNIAVPAELDVEAKRMRIKNAQDVVDRLKVQFEDASRKLNEARRS